MTDLNPDKMTVAELRTELAARGLESKGLKAALVKRLKDALAGNSEAPAEENQEKPKRGAAKRKKAAEKEEEDEGDGKEEAEEEEKPAKKIKAAASAPKKLTKAKVDVHCSLSNQGGVVYSSATETFDVMLNQTNISANNNKYYVIQLIECKGNYYTWNRWGRVGEVRANQTKLQNFGKNLDGAIKDFCKKFREKTANNWENRDKFQPKSGKYTLIEMSYSDDEEDEKDIEAALEAKKAARKTKTPKVRPCTLDKPTQDLIRLIFDNDMFKEQLQTFNIDVKKMPLGKISKNQIAKGFEVLEELKEKLENGKASTNDINTLSSKFYTIIPHDFGRRVPDPLRTLEAIQQKMDLLEVLGDIVIAQNMLKENEAADVPDEVDHPLDVNYKKLGNNIKLLDKKSDTYKIIETYTYNTMGMRKDVWEIDRNGEFERFSKVKHLGNRKLLWHGTNVAVIVAILTTGLRIMPHSGGRVGRGLYFASENAKSAAYVGCARDGGKNVGFMFLNEVALGKEHHITQDDPSIRKPPSGYDSVVAMGRVEPDPKFDVKIPGKFGDVVVPQGKAINRPEYANSSFFNSEYLIYTEDQVYSRYLLKLEFSY